MRFRNYLSELKGKSVKQVKRFVLGNSSVDYDSFFGSIIFAYLLTASTKNFHMPIIDCKRQQLKLRFQICQVLKRLKIDENTFKFQESLVEVRPQSLFNLYDHNKRQGIINIQYIVDHHDYKEPIARKYLIGKMGSALTHLYFLINKKNLYTIAKQSNDQQVTEYLKKYQHFTEKQPFSEENYIEDNELLIEQMIRYGILLDTFNLDQKQRERWTVFDKKALQFIQHNKQYSFGYQQLQQLKFNNELNKKLTLEQSLIKDYKKFDYNGLVIEYSIIYLQPKEFYQHYQKEMKERFEQNQQKNHIYMLMSIFKSPNNDTNRQVAFRAKHNDKKLVSIIENFLATLGMKPLGPLSNWQSWVDPKATISRKIFDKQFRNYYTQSNKTQL